MPFLEQISRNLAGIDRTRFSVENKNNSLTNYSFVGSEVLNEIQLSCAASVK